MYLSNLSWFSMPKSPILSIKIVPLSALSKSPTFLDEAEANAPFSYPKSSFEITASGIATQFSDSKGLSLREEFATIAFATSFLPVPLSLLTFSFTVS